MTHTQYQFHGEFSEYSNVVTGTRLDQRILTIHTVHS